MTTTDPPHSRLFREGWGGSKGPGLLQPSLKSLHASVSLWSDPVCSPHCAGRHKCDKTPSMGEQLLFFVLSESCPLQKGIAESSLSSRAKEDPGLFNLYLDVAVNGVYLALCLLLLTTGPSWGGIRAAYHLDGSSRSDRDVSSSLSEVRWLLSYLTNFEKTKHVGLELKAVDCTSDHWSSKWGLRTQCPQHSEGVRNAASRHPSRCTRALGASRATCARKSPPGVLMHTED